MHYLLANGLRKTKVKIRRKVMKDISSVKSASSTTSRPDLTARVNLNPAAKFHMIVSDQHPESHVSPTSDVS